MIQIRFRHPVSIRRLYKLKNKLKDDVHAKTKCMKTKLKQQTAEKKN